jgi:hypothetical protein
LKSAIRINKDKVITIFVGKEGKILKFSYLALPLQLDLLVVVERSTTIADVRRLLEEQLAKQLDVLEHSISKETDVSYFLKERS